VYVLTIPAEKWDETNPDRTIIMQLILKHEAEVPHLQEMMNYYKGDHKILQETDRDNKLVCNHAKDIADTASSYFVGNPIAYKSQDSDLSVLMDDLEYAEADEADGDNGLDLSIYGRAYEYIFAEEDEPFLKIKNLAPENTFMVYDDSIEQRELFGVYYYIQKDDSGTSGKERYIATVLTKSFRWVFDLYTTSGTKSGENLLVESSVIETGVPHFLGEVPLVEYLNNKLAIGDYELQIPLIDAYNILMSDRIADKEQFIDAILAVYGTMLSDDDAETEGDGNGAAEAMKRLKKEKLLELPDTSKVEYVTRTFDESGVEILKKALEQDIHKFSHIPCLSDEAFGGNVSGVAMEFKLLGMENITRIKTRYYRKGLRKRLRIFCNYLTTSSRGSIDYKGITAEFTRAMPKNLLEISQFVANLSGVVSTKTLLSQIPFVDDPEEEMKAVREEQEEAVKRQQAMFVGTENAPPEEEPGQEEQAVEESEADAKRLRDETE
jgi:SPP1 family phage portal protein